MEYNIKRKIQNRKFTIYDLKLINDNTVKSDK